MKDVVIFGTGQIAELANYYLTRDAGRKVAAFTVDRAFRSSGILLERPLVDFEDLGEQYPPSDFDLFVAVSYTRLNKLRQERVEAAVERGYSVPSYVSSRAVTFDTFQAAPNQFILEDNTIQPFARIGRNVTLWSGNHVGHHSHIADHAFVTSHVVISGGVTIGARSFIGVNATIRNDVTIGADCIIGAGALVLTDVPDGSVVSPSGTEISRVPSNRVRKI